MRRSTKQWVKEALKTAGKIALEIVIVVILKKGGRFWK
jgi:hypothetical protein